MTAARLLFSVHRQTNKQTNKTNKETNKTNNQAIQTNIFLFGGWQTSAVWTPRIKKIPRPISSIPIPIPIPVPVPLPITILIPITTSCPIRMKSS